MEKEDIMSRNKNEKKKCTNKNSRCRNPYGCRERERERERVVFNCHDFIYNNIMNKQKEQKAKKKEKQQKQKEQKTQQMQLQK